MLNVDPPDHTRLRKLAAAAFTPSRVASLEPSIRALAARHLDTVAAGPDDVVDLVAMFTGPFPFDVIGELLGVPEEDRASLRRSFATLLSPWTGDPPPEAVAASDAVVGYLTDLVDAKAARPDDGLVSELVHAEVDGDHLDRRELLSTVFQLVVAGHDTTTNLLGNGVVALLDHPDQLAAIQADPTLLPGTVEELLRFSPPALHATFRYATEPLDIGGVSVPGGAQVLVCLAAPNRDGAAFDRPDRFDITRRRNRHLSFGHGIHSCLGAPLARLEGRIGLEGVLTRFPELRLAVPRDQLSWTHGDGVVLRGLGELPVLPGPDAGWSL